MFVDPVTESESYLPPRFDASSSDNAPSTSAIPLVDAQAAPVAGPSSSAIPINVPTGPVSINDSTEESQSQSQSQSQSNPASMPAVAAQGLSKNDTSASGELPPPSLSAPPASIPFVQPIESQFTQFSQAMEMENTQDAPSPPRVEAAEEALMDAEGEEEEVANSSAVIQEELVVQQPGQNGMMETTPSQPSVPAGFAFGFSQFGGEQFTQAP